jgi:hypothetical protein
MAMAATAVDAIKKDQHDFKDDGEDPTDSAKAARTGSGKRPRPERGPKERPVGPQPSKSPVPMTNSSPPPGRATQ